MKTIFFISLLLFSSMVPVAAQSTEDSLRSTIDQMFLAMKESDARSLLDCFTDSAILQTIYVDRQGKTVLRTEQLGGFGEQIAGTPKGTLEEKITYDIIRIDGPLAIVWTPYRFYAKGQFSHCGVNSFQMVRLNGRWKIQYIIDTRRRQGCN